MLSDDELTGLDEFALLAENAEQAGVNGPLPEVERVQAGAISALRWGGSAPRVIFLHGGGQNAHTWDTVIVGLGEPALAVDLPARPFRLAGGRQLLAAAQLRDLGEPPR